MKTYTPTLDAAILDRLRDYAALFGDDFPQAKPARWAGVYFQGLLLDGERKSIEPLSRRVQLPEGLTRTDPEQTLQQFVNPSPWDHQRVLKRYRAHLAQTFASPEGLFLFDDVSFPKPGTHSVGVPRPYCGALGKTANGPVAVSAHDNRPLGHYPWTGDSTCPRPGWPTPVGRTRPGFPTTRAASVPRPRSRWNCWTGSGPKGRPATRW